MTSLGLPIQTHYSSSSLKLKLKLKLKPSSSFKLYHYKVLNPPNLLRRIRRGTPCRAELSHDAPVAAALGACVLSSLVLPVARAPDDEDGDSAMDSTDSRLAVMSIISFIPYFNWLSWVFAWLDTGSRRYAVYSLVYLLPYLRSNLSLSPEESWLPIGSIILCIIHVQLETSIRNGDIQGFQLFSEASKRVSSTSRQKDSFKVSHQNAEERKDKQRNLLSADNERLNEDSEEDEKNKH